MPVQAFVDDSGNGGDTHHFVLAGLVSHSDDWLAFSDEWRALLRQTPAIQRFKMKDAASCSGQFFGVSRAARDEKLRQLARIINRHARLATYAVIDLKAHSQTWALLPKPMNEPYFWAFHNNIMATCFSLSDIGWRERFEVIFDEQLIFGPRAKRWYPVVQATILQHAPDAAAILPVEPTFKNDDECMPIQAADLFAWCLRRGADARGRIEFEWLLDEMPNVKQTGHSKYYDLPRMIDSMSEMLRNLSEGRVSPALTEMARHIAQRKR